MKYYQAKILILLFMLLSGCGGGSTSTTVTNPPPSQGTRILGLHVNSVPSVTYASAYDQAMTLGAREVSVSLDWSTLEPTVGNYDDTLPATIEAYYPNQAGDVALVLRPLDTSGPRLPANLAGKALNDPAVITAFENFLTHLHAQMPTLNTSGKLKWIHVGNEIDASLGSDAARWSQWQTFFNAAKVKIKSLWGTSVVVSSIVQFSALNTPAIKTLYLNFLPNLDSAALTYYPLNADFTVQPTSSIVADFDLMTSSITNKLILLQECGYPSSTVNRSSETQQADFVSAVFKAWDTYRDKISLIDFAWQYDVSDATASQWVIDYGMSGQPYETEFKNFLLSLGFNHYDSTEKIAMLRVRSELLTRAWVH